MYKTYGILFAFMDTRLTQSQTQRQVLAPQMQQSIEVLLLPLQDLEQAIEVELTENPLLEIDTPEPSLIDEGSEGTTRFEKALDASDFFHAHGPWGPEENDVREDHRLKTGTTLEEHLRRQAVIELNDPVDIAIFDFIVGNLDEDGYLTVSIEEILAHLRISDQERVERVLKILRSLDPKGCGARSLKECLLAQAEDREPASRIIAECLEDVASGRHRRIARTVGHGIPIVMREIAFITSLDPRPARNFPGRETTFHIRPDVYVDADDEGRLRVALNTERLPGLRVNAFYRRLLRRPGIDRQEKAFIRERFQRAVQFIRSVRQRGRTIEQIAQVIVDRQKAFFTNGHLGLAPLSLRDVAEALDRNESTISRAIANKYMETPKGLFPMKFFFSQGVSARKDGTMMAGRGLREEIRVLIEEEDPESPLSDEDIQKIFARRGITLARRTVAKYRKLSGIPSSHQRKRRRR